MLPLSMTLRRALSRSFGLAPLALAWLVVSPLTHAATPPDDALYTALLQNHVHGTAVDYRRIADDPRLDRYLAQVATFDPASLPSPEAQLALWINAYNAYTLKLITTVHPVDTIRRITALGQTTANPDDGRPWDIRFARVGEHDYTLGEIEHQIIRPRFRDARIHFALVCAAVSCPQLRGEAYTGPQLDAQLTEQGRWFLTHRNRLDGRRRHAELSQIFQWYVDDFGPTPAALLDFLADFASPDLARDLRNEPDRWQISHAEYDWALNDRR